MNDLIQSDFAEFVNNEELFKSSAKLYDTKGGTLVFEGNCIYDEKPRILQNEDGSIAYSGEMSIVSFSMSDLVSFMPNYFNLKGYYLEVTTNNQTKKYFIGNSTYSSNVNCVYCDYLTEDNGN